MLNENHLIKDNINKLRLLTESVDQKSIIDAIEGKDVIYIYYQGDNTTNRGYRTIEPYALGTHKTTGNLLLRAHQQAGASDTKRTRPDKWNSGGINKGGWRLFNVEGISSFMPTNNKFKEEVTPRPNFNPNDKELNVISTYSDEEIPRNGTKGDGSIEDPNVQSRDGSAFDSQTSGLKSFGVDSNDFQYKKELTHLFGKLKFSRKQNPLNYIVVQTPSGELTLKTKASEERHNPQSVVGNLDDLFKDVSGLQDTKRVSQKAFEKFQNGLNTSGSLLGGERSRPIDKTFFNKQEEEFEKSLQNN